MTDPRDYVPSDALVRATIAASARDADHADDADVDRCPAWPFDPADLDALSHVAECASCQATRESEVAARDDWSAAVAYVPSETLVVRVMARSSSRPFRLHLLDAPTVPARRRSLGARMTALFGVSGLSPAVLAAAVVLHAAIGAASVWLAGPSRAGASGRRPVATVERVTLVALPSTTVGEGSQRALAVAVRQTMGAVSVTRGLPRRDLDHLDSTAALLRRVPTARVRLEIDTSAAARTAGELLRRYLMERGVSRDRSTIVSRGVGRDQVTIVLDEGARPPR